MPKESILKGIKRVVPDMIDKNGNFRTIPIGMVQKRNLSEYRLGFLRTFLDLVLHTKWLSNETRIYLSDPYISIKGVNEQLNAASDKHIPYNTTSSKIGYDRYKIESKLGANFLVDLLMYTNNKSIIQNYEARMLSIMESIGMHDSKSIRDKIALNLDKRLFCRELDDDKFYEFIKDIMPYFKSHMDAVANNLDRDSIGYFNYILSSPMLTDIDKKRLDYVSDLILGKGPSVSDVEVE